MKFGTVGPVTTALRLIKNAKIQAFPIMYGTWFTTNGTARCESVSY